jgi:hypothetical protein
MVYIYIRFCSNYADEFDVDEFEVYKMTDEEYNAFMEHIDVIKRKHREETGYGVGTNEFIEFDTGVEYLDAFDIQEITENEYQVLTKFGFGFEGWGLKDRIEDLYEDCKDLEDANDEEDEYDD